MNSSESNKKSNKKLLKCNDGSEVYWDRYGCQTHS